MLSTIRAFILSSAVLADPYLLLLQADGTLSGCSISQKNLVNLWTVPGRLLPLYKAAAPAYHPPMHSFGGYRKMYTAMSAV